MNIKIIIGLSSFAVGVLTGILSTKKYFSKKYDMMYEESKCINENMRRNYEKQGEEILRGLNDGFESINQNVEVDRSERKKEMKERINTKPDVKIDYTAFYKNKPGSDEESIAALKNIEGKEEFPDDPGWTDERINQWFEDHKNDSPIIISDREYDDLPPGIETSYITLYHFDETLVDDDTEEVIDNDKEVLFEGCIDNFYDSSDEKVIVLNASLGTAYIITRILDGYYSNVNV